MSNITDPIIAALIVRDTKDIPETARPKVAEALNEAMQKCEVPPATGLLAGLSIPAELMGLVIPRQDEKCMQAEYDAHIKPLLTPGDTPSGGKTR